jgi:hypothetical protein
MFAPQIIKKYAKPGFSGTLYSGCNACLLDILACYHWSRNLFERRGGGSVTVALSSSSKRGSIFGVAGPTEDAGVLVPDRPHDSREAFVLSIEEVSLQVSTGLFGRCFI